MTPCPVCGSLLTHSFLQRRSVPVHQNLPFPDRASAIAIDRGTLNLHVCESCGFIFNAEFEAAKLSYGALYDNTQTCSAAFEQYVDGLVQRLVYENQVQNCCIVEVGCGKGQFLRKLIEVEDWGNIGYGFDPSYVGPEQELGDRLQFKREYFNAAVSPMQADIIICRHVIEHIPNPLTLLQTIRASLTRSPHARLFFETPCVRWILTHQVIWDFFYEHCSYFTAESLTLAFQATGFQVERVQSVFQDQYLWLEAVVAPQDTSSQHSRLFHAAQAAPSRPPIPALAHQFAAAEHRLIAHWMQTIDRLTATGRVALWGAGAKGVTFANLIDPAGERIDCVIDLNPNKQGKYIPGTGHPIVSYRELGDRAIRHAILMNPNYYKENLALLEAAQLPVNLIAG